MVAFAFLAGLTVCGLAGDGDGARRRRARLSFGEPFVSQRQSLPLGWSLVLLAGPFMVANEAIIADAAAAHRRGRRSAGIVGVLLPFGLFAAGVLVARPCLAATTHLIG